MRRRHDRDNSGAVNLEEFRTLHQFLLETQSTFQQADIKRKGRIDKLAVERALQAQGMPPRLCIENLQVHPVMLLHIQRAQGSGMPSGPGSASHPDDFFLSLL